MIDTYPYLYVLPIYIHIYIYIYPRFSLLPGISIISRWRDFPYFSNHHLDLSQHVGEAASPQVVPTTLALASSHSPPRAMAEEIINAEEVEGQMATKAIQVG